MDTWGQLRKALKETYRGPNREREEYESTRPDLEELWDKRNKVDRVALAKQASLNLDFIKDANPS